MFSRIVAEHTAHPSVQGSALTIDETLVAYWQHVEQYYRDADGSPTSEVEELRRSPALVQRLYGATPTANFGPRSLATVRNEMIAADWCRTLINNRINRVKRAFK